MGILSKTEFYSEVNLNTSTMYNYNYTAYCAENN